MTINVNIIRDDGSMITVGCEKYCMQEFSTVFDLHSHFNILHISQTQHGQKNET